MHAEGSRAECSGSAISSGRTVCQFDCSHESSHALSFEGSNPRCENPRLNLTLVDPLLRLCVVKDSRNQRQRHVKHAAASQCRPLAPVTLLNDLITPQAARMAATQLMKLRTIYFHWINFDETPFSLWLSRCKKLEAIAIDRACVA